MTNTNKDADNRQHRLALAAEVSQRVQIGDICLVQSETRRGNWGANPDGAVEISVSHQTTATVNRDESRLLIVLNCVVEARRREVEGDQDSGPRIEAMFLASYRLERSEGLEQENFDAFGEFNGLFNIWPYCREFVQSMTTRMGLPALTLPIQRPVKRVAKMVQEAKSLRDVLPEANGDHPRVESATS